MEARMNKGYRYARARARAHSDMADLLPFLRKMACILSFSLLLKYLQNLHIAPLGLRISTLRLLMFYAVLHIAVFCLQSKEKVCRGWLYEAAAVALPLEIGLFPVFLQQHFEAGAVIACLFLFFAVFFGLLRTHALMNMTLLTDSAYDFFFADLDCRNLFKRPALVLYRRALAVVTAFLLLIPALTAVFEKPQAVSAPAPHASAVLTGGNNLFANYETIRLFHEETWPTLTEQEKTAAMQVIADIETNHLGIAPVSVTVWPLDEGTLGSYAHSARQVMIDLAQIEAENDDVIRVILHECRHAYQHDCVDHVDWDDPVVQTLAYYAPLRRWKEELTNYLNASVSFDAYYTQDIEADARAYAVSGGADYDEFLYYPYPSR